MSSNNQNEMDIGDVIIVVGMLSFGMLIALLAAAFAFCAILGAILACFALFRPITLFGGKLYPEDALAYLVRGGLGAMALMFFILFAGWVFQLDTGAIKPHWWQLIWLGGFSLGSLGAEIMNAADQESAPQQVTLSAPTKPTIIEHKPREPFRYASWDDEELRP